MTCSYWEHALRQSLHHYAFSETARICPSGELFSLIIVRDNPCARVHVAFYYSR